MKNGVPTFLVLLAACGGSPATHARYDPDAALQRRDFFALPFPCDLRRSGDGLDLTGFPNPESSALLSDYVVAMRSNQGFALGAPMYVAFDGPVDPATITPQSVRVVDVDAQQGVPLETRWYAQPTLFLPANTLAMKPLDGFPLRAGGHFAIVLTADLHDLRGKPVQADAAMHPQLPGAVYDARFTTHDPWQVLPQLRAAVRATPQPAPQNLISAGGTPYLFTGTFPVPNFQTGAPPYLASGGELTLTVQRTESVRFAVSLPSGAGPFPAVLYEHGTGGSYRSFYDEGLAADFAARGIAMISMDQVLHGPRNPSCTEGTAGYENCVGEAFFNFANPYAGRDNTRQGAADGFQLLRLAKAITIPAAIHPEGHDVTLRGFAFLGHSQGGLTGAPFVSAEPELAAAALSGTGAVLAISVLERKDPIDFKAVAELLLGISGKESLDPFHPAIAVLQTFGEPADPLSVAAHLADQHPVLLTEGLVDPYVASAASEALGAAAGFGIGGAVVHENAAFVAKQLPVWPLPHALPSGGVLLQFPNDGHFAMFDNPVARCRVETFLAGALAGAPSVAPCGG